MDRCQLVRSYARILATISVALCVSFGLCPLWAHGDEPAQRDASASPPGGQSLFESEDPPIAALEYVRQVLRTNTFDEKRLGEAKYILEEWTGVKGKGIVHELGAWTARYDRLKKDYRRWARKVAGDFDTDRQWSVDWKAQAPPSPTAAERVLLAPAETRLAAAPNPSMEALAYVQGALERRSYDKERLREAVNILENETGVSSGAFVKLRAGKSPGVEALHLRALEASYTEWRKRVGRSQLDEALRYIKEVLEGAAFEGFELRRAADVCERWTGIPSTGVIAIGSSGDVFDWIPLKDALKKDLKRWRKFAKGFGRKS